MNQPIPVEVEFTVQLKQFGTPLTKRGEKFIAIPIGVTSSRRHLVTWVIIVQDIPYYIFYVPNARKNRPGRFRVIDWPKAYAKLAEDSDINKLAALLYRF